MFFITYLNCMKNPIFLGFYGESNTGKTSIIVSLLKKLKQNHLKTAVIKITNKDVSLDTVGKDTFRFGEVDCDAIIFISNIETDFIFKNKFDFKNIINIIKFIDFYDIILIEGCYEPSLPKIRIGKGIKIRKNTLFDYDGDLDKIFDYLIGEIQKKKELEKDVVSLNINGKEILLSDFPSEFIKNILLGIAMTFKDLKGKNNDLEIILKFEKYYRKK